MIYRVVQLKAEERRKGRRDLLKAEYEKHRILNRISRNMRDVSTLSQGVFSETVDAIYDAIADKYGLKVIYDKNRPKG